MGFLKFAFVLFILSFPIAEIGRFQFSNGIAVSVNDILLGLVIVSWLRYRVLFKRKKLKGYLKKSIFIFSGLALFSLVLNAAGLNLDQFTISFLYLVRFFSYALIYFIVKDFDLKFNKKISFLLIFVGLIVVLGGYVQYFLYPNLRNLYYLGWDEHLYRMFSSFLDPNFAGAFFVVYFLYTLSFAKSFFTEKNWIGFWVLITIVALSGAAIYLTYSRSALLMLIVSVVVYLIFENRKKLIFISVIIMLLLVFILPKSFKTEGTNFLRITSSQARITSIQSALNIFETSPIFGIGFNAYRYVQNKQGLVGIDWRVTHSGAGTDNSFLFVLATMGIIGLFSYLYLLKCIFYLAKQNLKKNKYSIVLASVLAGLIINSFFINSLFFVIIMEWVWILSAFMEKS